MEEETAVVVRRGARMRVLQGTEQWLRLTCAGVAVVFAALAYHNHFRPDLPWWRWLGDLLAGALFFGIALGEDDKGVEGQLRRALRLTAAGVALVAALAALYLIPQRGRELAGGLTVIGALTAFFVARWRPFTTAEVRLLLREPVATDGARARGVGFIGCLGGVGFSIGAAVANPVSTIAGFGLWLASLIVFAFGASRLSRRNVDDGRAWESASGPLMSRGAEAVGLLLVLGLALGLRIVLLDQVPARVDMDEGRFGRFAESMWRNGFPDVFALGWNVFPNLSYLIGYVGVQLWGDSMANLRLSYAVVGVLSLVPMFYWAKRWWGNVVALMAVVLMAVSYSHLYWSRVGLNNIHQVAVAGLILAAFARVLDRRQPLDWVWLGYAAGLGFHTYHAAKLFPFLLVPPFVLFAVGVPGFLRTHVRGACIGAVAFLVCIGPLAVTTFVEWGHFVSGTANRADIHALLNAYTAGDVESIRRYVYAHVVGCLYVFIDPDSTFLSPIPGALFLIGLAWVLWTWRDPRHLVALAWVAGILFLGGMMTSEPPSVPRLLGMFPVIFVVPALVAGRLRGVAHECLRERADLVVVPALLICGGLTLHYNWERMFFVHQAKAAGAIMPVICDVLEETPLPTRVYIGGGKITDPTIAPNTCMMPLDAQRAFVSFANDAGIVPLPPNHRGNGLLLVMGDQAELVSLIEHYYPDIRYRTHGQSNDTPPSLYFFTLPDHLVDRHRGLTVVYEAGERVWTAPATQHALEPPEGVTGAVNVSATGLVWISPSGSYRFKATSGAVKIDGHRVDADTPLFLVEGWHGIEVRSAWKGTGSPVTLYWLRPQKAKWAPIQRAYLFAHPKVHGLLGRYFARALPHSSADPITRAADFARIDTALTFDFHPQADGPSPPGFGQSPSTMEWTGTVELPEGDVQEIRLEASAPTQIFLDGKEVLAVPGAAHPKVTEKVLLGVSGRVSVLVRTKRPEGDALPYWTLRLLWRAPGGEWSAFVPYEPAFDDQRSVVSMVSSPAP
jgi:hypothetical protein